MPQYMINDGGLGSLFAKAVDSGGLGLNLRDQANAYRIRQAMDLAQQTAARNNAKTDAEVAKLNAETAGQKTQNDLLTNQISAADSLGGTYGDFFKDQYVQNHMTPENTEYGPQEPAVVRRQAIPDSTGALLAAQGRTAALAMPGADPEKVAAAQRMMLGNNEMLFGTDPTRIRIGAAAALDKLPDANTVLTPSDRDAALQDQIAVTQAKVRAKADATGASGPFGGNSEYSTNARIISDTLAKHQRGEPLTPDDVNNYQIAYSKLYGPQTHVQIDPQSQRQFVIQTTPQVPQAVQGFDPSKAIAPTPDALINPSAAASAPAQPPTNNLMQPSASTIPAAGQGAAPATSPSVNSVSVAPGATVTTIGGGVKPLTEAESRDASFASTMNMANDHINSLLAKNNGVPPLGPLQLEVMRGTIGNADARGYVDTVVQNLANANASPDTQSYVAAVENFINPVLRKDSGAAVPNSEYPKYFSRFIPVYGDKPAVIAEKNAYRNAYLQQLNQSLGYVMQSKGINSMAELTQRANSDPSIAAQVRAAQDNAFNTATSANNAPAQAGGAALSDEDLLRKYGGGQ